MFLLKKIKDARYRIILKNSLLIALLKIVNLAITLFTVPLLLNYLGQMNYGIWLSIGSIISWISVFDLGLGNGLQNKLTQFIAIQDIENAKIHIATTYVSLGLILIVLDLIFYFISSYIPWNILLNVNLSNNYIIFIINIAINALILQLILKLCLTLLFAHQKTSLIDLTNTLINLILFLILFLISKNHFPINPLTFVALFSSYIPVLGMIFVSLYIFTFKYKIFLPSLKDIQFTKSKEILNLGFKFLIFQVFGLVMYSTDNILISKFLSPELVVQYNISIKYFNLLNLPVGILIMPYWSAVTHAYQKQEFVWIKKSMKKLLLFYTLIVLFGLIMLFAAPLIYAFWLQNKIQIPMGLSIMSLIYTIIICYGNISNTIINASGKLTLLTYTAFVTMILNIPIAIFFVKYTGLGLQGILLSNIICWMLFASVSSIQSYKLLSGTAQNIWNQ